jgi:type II secretory pathway pseudopilin PulG
MTLLEIILSLGILAGALAVIANLSRLSTMSAVSARDTTQAQFLCESVMAQLMSGIIEFESVYDAPLLDFPDTGASNPNDSYDYKWVYSIEINSIDDYGLLEVIVTVTQYLPNSPRTPVSCRLVRWMLDKATALEMLESESDSTTGASGTTNGGGGSP